MNKQEAIAVLEKEASIIDDNSIEMTARELDAVYNRVNVCDVMGRWLELLERHRRNSSTKRRTEVRNSVETPTCTIQGE